MLILKKEAERNIIYWPKWNLLHNLRGLRTGSFPWVLSPRETLWMTKRVLILFSAVHLSSCIPRSPQGAAEDDDGGGSLKLTKGRKGTECCSPAVSTYSTGTSGKCSPSSCKQLGGEERAKCLCFVPGCAIRVVPQGGLRRFLQRSSMEIPLKRNNWRF